MNSSRKLILLFAFALSLLSCKRDPVPRDAIDRELFVAVLIDVHLSEAIYRDRTRIKLDSITSPELYLAVLKKHGVSEEQMLTTTLYYSRNQKEYDKIFGDVLSGISLLMEEKKGEEKVIIN
ncbi:DUF4296 domain-containing protein [Roseimarinus sediminis]|jgi:hypothetical protein|uniref:DUF4296 domain-containing protein n=1 Tax=Roseimarinus sediminis TaxID=1610899 RepID=UPI003D256F2A